MNDVQTYVLYDIEDDRIRNRVAEACKDYGLTRIQYSAFAGLLNRNKRGELYFRMMSELGSRPGKILILPVCEKDVREGRHIQNEPESAEDQGEPDDPAAGQ